MAVVLDSAILEAVLPLFTRVRLNFWFHETFMSPFPRVFCKCLATAFQIPILPLWSACSPQSSSQPGSGILPEGLGACTQCAMTGSQVKLITVIIFIVRNSSINSKRFLCFLYLGTSHTHRERDFKGTNKESESKSSQTQGPSGFLLWYLNHLMMCLVMCNVRL